MHVRLSAAWAGSPTKLKRMGVAYSLFQLGLGGVTVRRDCVLFIEGCVILLHSVHTGT